MPDATRAPLADRVRRGHVMLARGIILGVLVLAGPAEGETELKHQSSFYRPEALAAVRTNVARFDWAAEARDRMVASAEPWLRLSDDELWALMFGPRITRSWMVWSDGHCPACKQGVPMYSWRMDAMGEPWKVRCPQCREAFPKNDFEAFYRSGLDAHGVFDPARADRGLLFNAEHPAADDPSRGFGVDDGEGYVEGEKRWRFIGAYLIYGQWKQAIIGGIDNLAAAYVVTGDPKYAHKAGVMLDRVADLYPGFDFGEQGIVYERKGDRGYVSTWHDAAVEIRHLVLAYDEVFEAIRNDEALVTFLSGKAKQFGLENPKASFADIQRNIDDRLLSETIEHPGKIQSNYPMTEISVALARTVLAWPANREKVMGLLDEMIDTATAVDGLSGEKGLTGYSAIAPRSTAEILGRFARLEPGLLGELLARHPRIHDMYRFHIDTHCLDLFYPLIGDCGGFAQRTPGYSGATFARTVGLDPSDFTLFYRLYEATGDVDLLRVMHRANGGAVEKMPYDLFEPDPAAFQAKVRSALEEKGAAIRLGNVNKEQWHLAILRSGEGDDRRAVWIDYDSHERHSHRDGMNVGLFAKGLDLMPDYGYPPVQFGGWGSPRARWYTMTAAHNTVVVDGQDQKQAAGSTTLWAEGEGFRAIRVSSPEMIGGGRYERTLVMIDVSDEDFYVVDVFRVAGGKDHAKFMQSNFGEVTTTGLELEPAEEFGNGTQTRSFRRDANPDPGWSVDWRIKDPHESVPTDADVHLRCTDLTTGGEAWLCEGWVAARGFDSNDETWIPRVLTRRRAGEAPLTSTFVAVIEPYAGASRIAAIRRVALRSSDGGEHPDADVAIEVELADGRRDVIVAVDPEAKRDDGVRVEARAGERVELTGELAWVRREHDGSVRHVETARCRRLVIDGREMDLPVRE